MRREFNAFWNRPAGKSVWFSRRAEKGGVTKEVIFGAVNRVSRTCSKIPKLLGDAGYHRAAHLVAGHFPPNIPILSLQPLQTAVRTSDMPITSNSGMLILFTKIGKINSP